MNISENNSENISTPEKKKPAEKKPKINECYLCGKKIEDFSCDCKPGSKKLLTHSMIINNQMIGLYVMLPVCHTCYHGNTKIFLELEEKYLGKRCNKRQD